MKIIKFTGYLFSEIKKEIILLVFYPNQDLGTFVQQNKMGLELIE